MPGHRSIDSVLEMYPYRPSELVDAGAEEGVIKPEIDIDISSCRFHDVTRTRGGNAWF